MAKSTTCLQNVPYEKGGISWKYENEMREESIYYKIKSIKEIPKNNKLWVSQIIKHIQSTSKVLKSIGSDSSKSDGKEIKEKEKEKGIFSNIFGNNRSSERDENMINKILSILLMFNGKSGFDGSKKEIKTCFIVISSLQFVMGALGQADDCRMVYLWFPLENGEEKGVLLVRLFSMSTGTACIIM